MSVKQQLVLYRNNFKYQKYFEELLFDMSIHYSSKSTKDGIVYLIQFSSESQYVDFKKIINKLIQEPYI